MKKLINIFSTSKKGKIISLGLLKYKIRKKSCVNLTLSDNVLKKKCD